MNTKTLLIGFLLIGTLAADDWPAFRGASGNGVSTDKSAPLEWSAEKNVKWKVALPQPANGSPIVSNGRVFCTAPQDKDGKERSLYCFDRKDGKQIWVRTVKFGKKMPTHKTNPYCGSTPAADGERVVVWHSSAGLYCYDFEGKELWKRDFGEFRHKWGYGTSPVIYKEKVILHTGPGKRVLVMALDVKTGKTVWEKEEEQDGDGQERTKGGPMGSWVSPVLHKGQIILTMPKRLVGYDAETGDIVWWCTGITGPRGDLAYSSPVIAGDVCMALGGWGGPALAVRLGGKGDVTKTHRLWREGKCPTNIGTGVAVGDHIYRPNAGPATLECVDPKTGKVLWTERAGKRNFWGSMIVAAGRIYVNNQGGTTYVFKPNAEKFGLLATNELGETSNSTPAFSDGEIFIQTHEHLFCIADE